MPYADPEQKREYQRKYQREWNRRNPEKRQQITQASDRRRQNTDARRAMNKLAKQRRHIRQRVEVIERYGGKCAFCGTKQYEHLTIDHVNGDGGTHREAFEHHYRGIADYLYRTEFRPDLYRVLCWNCHMAMTRYDVKPGHEPLHDMDYWREFGALRRRPNGTY